MELQTLKEKLEQLRTHSKKKKTKTQEKVSELRKIEKELEKINDEFTDRTIELLTTEKTTIDGYLWQEELIRQYKLSAFVLGALDFKLEYYRNEVIDHTETFDAEKLQKAKRMYQKYQQYRSEATLLYQHATSRHELATIKQALSKTPSYEDFGEVYEDFAINHYQLELQKALLEAYTEGYTSSRKLNTDELFNSYNVLATKLIRHKQNNRRRVDEVKNPKTKTHQQ